MREGVCVCERVCVRERDHDLTDSWCCRAVKRLLVLGPGPRSILEPAPNGRVYILVSGIWIFLVPGVWGFQTHREACPLDTESKRAKEGAGKGGEEGGGGWGERARASERAREIEREGKRASEKQR